MTDSDRPSDVLPDPPEEGREPASRCPFLGEAADGPMLICLADVEPVAVSRRYGDSYCLTEAHVYCSLYIAAVSGERSASPEVVAAVDMARRRIQTEGPPTVREPVPLHADVDDTVVETRVAPLEGTDPEAAAEVARELSDAIRGLAEQLASTKDGNAALSRRVLLMEEMADNPDFLRHALATMPGVPVAADDVAAVRLMLQTLLRNPQDLRGLAMLAGRTNHLELIVNAYARLFTLLDEQGAL